MAGDELAEDGRTGDGRAPPDAPKPVEPRERRASAPGRDDRRRSDETPNVDLHKRILASQTRTSRDTSSSGGVSGENPSSSVTSIPHTRPGSSEEPSDDTPVPSGTRLSEWLSPPLPLPIPRRTLSATITHDVAVGPSAAAEILQRRSSASSSSSHPSAAITTDDTSPLRSPSSRTSSLLRRLSAPKPEPHLVPASDDESAPSLSGSGAESTGEGSSAAETATSSFVGSSLSASDSVARASASASAGSDSSEPFPKPLPRSVTHRLVVIPQTSDSSSDNVAQPPPTRTRIPLRRPPPTPLPPDSLEGGRYVGQQHTITLTPQQVSALTLAPQQVSAGTQTDFADFHQPPTPPGGGNSSGSDHGNGSETNDKLSQLPQRPWVARNTSQRLPRTGSYESIDRRPSLPSSANSYSSYSSLSGQSARSEPLMHRRQSQPDRATLHRSYSLTGGQRPGRSTRPPRVEDVEAVYRNLIDLTAYPLSPLGELTGVGQPHSAGMYSPDLTPSWLRVAPRIRNTGGLAPHGSFTSRRSAGPRSSTPPLTSSAADTVAQSSRSRKATRGSASTATTQSTASGRVTPSSTAKVDKADTLARALKRASLTSDPTADVSHLGDAHLSRNELDGLEHAAALGDQLAAYHLGRGDSGRRDGHRRAISSSATVGSARPPAVRRPTAEGDVQPPPRQEYLSFSSASSSSSSAPRQTSFFSGQRHRHA